MPTGGGKSLCYQLPGIASDELTVVVSPLIALMADQYRRLRLVGHPAAMIASGMDAGAAARALADVREGRRGSCCARPSASPPRRSWPPWRAPGRPVRRRRGPLRLGVGPRLPARLPAAARGDRAPRLADGDGVHGDGDRAGGQEISARLGLRDPYVLRAGFDRPNLSFDVIALDGPGTKARKRMLLSIALQIRPSGPRSSTAGPGARSRRCPSSCAQRACWPSATTPAWRPTSAPPPSTGSWRATPRSSSPPTRSGWASTRPTCAR